MCIRDSNKKGSKAEEAELRQSIANSEESLTVKRARHQEAWGELKRVKKLADGERRSAYTRITSERMLYETAACTRAFQEASEGAERLLSRQHIDAMRIERAKNWTRSRRVDASTETATSEAVYTPTQPPTSLPCRCRCRCT